MPTWPLGCALLIQLPTTVVYLEFDLTWEYGLLPESVVFLPPDDFLLL